MTQPVHYLRHRMRLLPIRHSRAVDHDDRQAKTAGGGDLGIGTGTTSILGHNQINAMLLHQCKVVSFGKRPARHQHMVIRKGRQVFGWIDQTQKIEMLRIRRELHQMHPTDGQHDADGGLVQGGHSTRNVRHTGPGISGLRTPRLAGQCDQRNVSLSASLHRIPTHLRGKGVGRINHMGDLFIAHVRNQSVDPTKSADTLGQRLALGPLDTARKADHTGQPRFCGSVGKGGGFGRTGKDQEVGAHV